MCGWVIVKASGEAIPWLHWLVKADVQSTSAPMDICIAKFLPLKSGSSALLSSTPRLENTPPRGGVHFNTNTYPPPDFQAHVEILLARITRTYN